MSWQPIETAPKDGTKILIYVPAAYGDEPNPESEDIFTAEWSGNYWYVDLTLQYGPKKATHWMPLPEPPK